MSNIKKTIIAVIAIVVLAGAVVGIKYQLSVSKYKKTVSSFKFGTIDLAKVADGEYIGFCDVDFIEAEVRVKVANHKITKIDLLQHKNGKGEAAEVIIEEVIKKQSLEVDTISGATNSSKVILKAIENAVTSNK